MAPPHALSGSWLSQAAHCGASCVCCACASCACVVRVPCVVPCVHGVVMLGRQYQHHKLRVTPAKPPCPSALARHVPQVSVQVSGLCCKALPPLECRSSSGPSAGLLFALLAPPLPGLPWEALRHNVRHVLRGIPGDVLGVPCPLALQIVGVDRDTKGDLAQQQAEVVVHALLVIDTPAGNAINSTAAR